MILTTTTRPRRNNANMGAYEPQDRWAAEAPSAAILHHGVAYASWQRQYFESELMSSMSSIGRGNPGATRGCEISVDQKAE
jgi:hypothetical protein